MIHEVFMPALSSTMTEGKIVSWVKSPGDKVEKGETVVVVESDKADMDVETFYEGYIATILVESGDTAPVGSAIALIAETESEIATAKQQASSPPEAKTADATTSPGQIADVANTVVTPAPSQNGSNIGDGRIIVSPRARKLAKEMKVDLSSLAGSGPHGRIVAEDVETAANISKQPPTPVAPPPVASPPPVITSTAPVIAAVSPGEVVPMNTLQNAVVRNMMASLQVPTFHVGYTITTEALDTLYKQIKSKGVTMTALLAKAVAVTLQKHPLVNASYSEQKIVYHPSINIACGADGVMIGSPFARAAEAPGNGYHWGMATPSPVLPRGTRIRVGTTGTLKQILRGPALLDDGTHNLLGALKTSMGTLGAKDIKEMQQVDCAIAPSLLTEGKVYQKAQQLGMGK